MTLIVTCLTLAKPKTATMHFLSVLLDRYPDKFAWFSLRSPRTPIENPYTIPKSHFTNLTKFSKWPGLRLILNYNLWTRIQALKAIHFARKNKCEVVFADLAFEAVVVGRLVANWLSVPLLVNVHDDPVARIRIGGYPEWFLRWYEAQFAKTLRAARRVGVISDSMGEVYQQRYGVRTTTLYIGVEEEKCLPARCPDPQKQPILITSLGSVNSTENWNLLIAAVRRLNRQSGEEKFRILHVGSLNARLATPPEVEVTGWLPEKEFLQQLERADICFLNASFAPEQAEVGRLSFPLKIHSYIQAQRSMLALGPSESSVVRFVLSRECGLVCEQADEALLAETILRMVSAPSACPHALQGLAKLKQSFSREQFFTAFENFSKVSDDVD